MAKEAGVSFGTVFTYFDFKDKLYEPTFLLQKIYTPK
ncbi:hypothetical protein [Lysinibacillus fusiformis]